MYIVKVIREDIAVFMYSKRMTVLCEESARVFTTEKQALSYWKTSEFKGMQGEVIKFEKVNLQQR